jgi:SAM-dependent methyltransferase
MASEGPTLRVEAGERQTGDGVPPSSYDSRYFLGHCEGFIEFRESGGRRLVPRFRKALRLARIEPGQRVLDIGCGRGELVLQAALRGAEAVGIDYAEEAVRIARENLAGFGAAVQGRAAVLLMNARTLEFDDESFDVALMTGLVEHLYPKELAEALREAWRVLRPGARLVVHTSPNRAVYDIAFPAYARHVNRAAAWLAKLFRLNDFVIHPGLPCGPAYPRSEEERLVHVNEQTAPQLRHVLRRAGFRVRKTDHWEPPLPPGPQQLFLELMLLDSVRYLRPVSYHWPLNRLFTNHIWMVAERV